MVLSSLLCPQQVLTASAVLSERVVPLGQSSVVVSLSSQRVERPRLPPKPSPWAPWLALGCKGFFLSQSLPHKCRMGTVADDTLGFYISEAPLDVVLEVTREGQRALSVRDSLWLPAEPVSPGVTRGQELLHVETSLLLPWRRQPAQPVVSSASPHEQTLWGPCMGPSSASAMLQGHRLSTQALCQLPAVGSGGVPRAGQFSCAHTPVFPL